MGIDRRTFLKALGVGSRGDSPGVSVSPGSGHAKEISRKRNEELDGGARHTTRCVGCRRREMACADGPTPALEVPDIGDTSVSEKIRPTSEKQMDVGQSFSNKKGEVSC